LRNEEIQRAIEFIIQQQAKYEARFEQDEARIARVEESFTVLVELVRSMDERLDRDSSRLDTDEVRLARVEQDEARIARLEQSFRILVELAQSMDERSDTIDNELSTLHGNMSTLSRTMNELAQRTITDESRLMRLEESFKMLVELAHRHG